MQISSITTIQHRVIVVIEDVDIHPLLNVSNVPWNCENIAVRDTRNNPIPF